MIQAITRDLSIIFNPNLSSDIIIIGTTVAGCTECPTQISYVKHCLDKSSLLTVINALVFSKMDYYPNVSANMADKNVQKLTAVQKFAC